MKVMIDKQTNDGALFCLGLSEIKVGKHLKAIVKEHTGRYWKYYADKKGLEILDRFNFEYKLEKEKEVQK